MSFTFSIKIPNLRVLYRDQLALITADDLAGGPLTEIIFETSYYWNPATGAPPVHGFWRWQSAQPSNDPSALAADASLGGWFVQFYPDGEITFEHMGAFGDYSIETKLDATIDNAAIQAAVDMAVAKRIPCRARRIYFTKQQNVASAACGAIRLPDGLNLIFEGDAGLASNSPPVVPWVYKQGRGRLELHGIKFYWGGQIDRANAPYILYNTAFSYFMGSMLQRPGYGGVPVNQAAGISGNGMAQAALFIAGGSNIILRNPEFISLHSIAPGSDNHKFILHALALVDANDGTNIRRCIIENPVMDGVLMGCTAVGFDTLIVSNPVGLRYGAMNVAWTAPGHDYYISDNRKTDNSAQKRSGTVTFINPQDEGGDFSEKNEGQVFLKSRGAVRCQVIGGYSSRPHGGLDGACENWQVSGYKWTVDLVKSNAGGVPALRLLGGTYLNGGSFQDIEINITNVGAAWAIPLQMYNAADMKITGKVTIDGFYTGSIFATMTDVNRTIINLDVISTVPVTDPNPQLVNMPSSGSASGNMLKFRTKNWPLATLRVIESAPAQQTDNTCDIEEITTGNRRLIASGGTNVTKAFAA